MTSPSNGIPTRPSPSIAPSSSKLSSPANRISSGTQSLASSISSLPYRSSASASSLFASTSTPPGSRSSSPSAAASPAQNLTRSVFASTPAELPQPINQSERQDDPRDIILHSYIPHIAVHTSDDTDELARDKGFKQGLWELLRSFGERIQGKVTIRDSVGASRSCEDFAVRFVKLGDGLHNDRDPLQQREDEESPVETGDENLRTGGNLEQIDALLDRHLSYAERFPIVAQEDYLNFKNYPATSPLATSPFYTLYLRRLLSGLPLVPYETFSHPVACIIAISSRNQSPIEALRKLYDETSRGDKRLPLWVNGDYLRYYVLVHDEEKDDISKSMTLFEQMKRHFGLHCHLLRLRSVECIPTDDDSFEIPPCEWVSSAEEIANIQEKEGEEDIDDMKPCIFGSDATAIKTFIREMVTQSVVPSMERCVSTWNDQVASRRRGISGRFMSLSKKWAGLGGSSRTTPTLGSTSGMNSNYDVTQSYYRPDTPEAIMRKLADYAFMLRDWKLAQSTYEILRSDFSNDKAWQYHAAANEMAAISSLLIPAAISSKVRAETIDQMLETASYSYVTRCSFPYGAVRCLALGVELLRIRGGSATEDGARWGSRLLEARLVGPIGEALLKERIAVCYASKKGAGSGGWGLRIRKSALWNLLAADAWLNLRIYQQSEKRLLEAQRLYSALPYKDSLSRFSEANAFVMNLERESRDANLGIKGEDEEQPEASQDETLTIMDEDTEPLGIQSHRRSIVGSMAPPLSNLETAPLHDINAGVDASASRGDDFQ